MISANDAAVALAEHDGGTVTRFVKEMNVRAKSMGLTCTHYSTPNGLRDRNNYSCAARSGGARAGRPGESADRADRADPHTPSRASRSRASTCTSTTTTTSCSTGSPGLPQARVTGLKTGFTDPAGRCYVTTARIGGHQLGVVLLALARSDHAGARPCFGRVSWRRGRRLRCRRPRRRSSRRTARRLDAGADAALHLVTLARALELHPRRHRALPADRGRRERRPGAYRVAPAGLPLPRLPAEPGELLQRGAQRGAGARPGRGPAPAPVRLAGLGVRGSRSSQSSRSRPPGACVRGRGLSGCGSSPIWA